MRYRDVRVGEDSPARVTAVIHALGGRETWRSRYVPGLAFVEVAPAIAAQTREILGVLPEVAVAERDVRAYSATTPNDPQWTGQNPQGEHQRPHFERIGMPCAWDLRTTSTKIVGLVDSGVLYTHPDFVPNLLVNTAELNGIGDYDDDNNGATDDVYGCEFLEKGDPFTRSQPWFFHGDPADVGGHGTKLMSVIGSKGNNATGMAGVAWTVPVVPAKFIGYQGGLGSNAILCIEYCIGRGATIINCSWFVLDHLDALYQVIKYTPDVLYVAACGNDGCNVDGGPPCYAYLPAAYQHDNIISVGDCYADDQAFFDTLPSSNWGPISVDVIAPAENIRVYNLQTGQYDFSGGLTSSAASMVTGLAALVWSEFPSMVPSQVRERIINTVDQLPQFSGRCVSGGRINAPRALGITCP